MKNLPIIFVIVALPVVISYDHCEEPGDLALVLNEDEFEEYLDSWLEVEEHKWANISILAARRTGCTFIVNADLGQPQPVYLNNNDYITPTGNTGLIHLDIGEEVVIGCTGSGRTIWHPNMSTSGVSTATATCVSNALVSGVGWLDGHREFGLITCSSHPFHEAEATSERCYNNNIVIRVGFYINDTFYPLYWSCFDQNRLEVLYVWYEQNPWNAVHQTNVDRPSWLAGSFFPGVSINNRYTQVQQKLKVATFVGNALADKYVTNTQFLARGHLAAKTDYIFATGQRATFYFINAAPQWQPFNAGNWNWLEQNLRVHIGNIGYNTVIYSGTYGVSQLRNEEGLLVDIYLHHDENNNPQLPVPLYYYKVVYDSNKQLGTAFVSINNPYYTETEVHALTFCTDHCRNNSSFSWLHWQPDRIEIGYSFCCEVEEFRRTVPHLPHFTVRGLLT